MSSVRRIELPLILGGHTFIAQLGNDPAADDEAQTAIVNACLNNGIRWIDTTYQPERIALGRILRASPRATDFHVIAWNFFRDFDSHGQPGGPDFYRPEHLQILLDQLQVHQIDAVVVHWIGEDEAANRRQEEVAIRWRDDGFVKQLGVWGPPADAAQRYSCVNPYQFVVWPTNIATTGIGEQLAWARKLQWRNFGASPFVRGWHLDKLLAKALEREPGDRERMRARLAGCLLRYALFLPNVDRLIVAMRKPQWVQQNAAAAMAGELRPAERAWLQELQAAVQHNNATS